MSGTPNKRLHEDSGGHPSGSRYSHAPDDSGTYPSVGGTNAKQTNTLAPMKDYHPASFDIGPDARGSKVPRTETRETDSRRSPLLSMYRPPPLGEPQSDPALNAEDRVESRDGRETNSRDLKIEGQDVKAESKELHQSAKGDKDVRYASRVDDHKETIYERNSYPDYRSDLKTDKDAYNAMSHPNWKELKDHHRVKKYPDTSGGNSNAPHVWCSSVHGPADAARESLTKEEKDCVDEAIAENRIDAKGEDRVKDKDRKRKDSKHQEWGEGNNLQACNTNDNLKDQMKDNRECDKWDKERKDKDKQREREKDHTKREPWIGNDKDSFQNEKEAMDASSKTLEQENSLEPKKKKISDGWKDFDKESKDRKRERDVDIEVERSERRIRGLDKDSDDGGLDVEGSADREREGLNYGVQQRKRMLRPRGSPQVTSRDPRFRSRSQDNDGSTGSPDVSTVIYRVGECMQELIKLWKDYKSSIPDKISESSQSGPTLEIHIPAEHVAATNRQVKGGQLWGTDIYTYDSDLVAVLMHTGYCRPTASPPQPAIQELHATIRVLHPQECYISTLRNNVRSRAWGAPVGCSFRVERCCILKKGGGTIDLEPCLTHTSTVEPTLAPVVVERTMTTRAAASNALRQQRFVREVTLQYNLCNEPWTKYSISAIADKGLKKPLYTAARLKKGEVLYLESRSCRYELCYNGEKMVKALPTAHANNVETEKYQKQGLHLPNGDRSMDGDTILMDVFRWSRCKKPLPQIAMSSIGIPLPLEHLEVLEYNLDWDEIQWSQTGVWISGKEYPLSRVHFLSPA